MSGEPSTTVSIVRPLRRAAAMSVPPAFTVYPVFRPTAPEYRDRSLLWLTSLWAPSGPVNEYVR